MRGFFSPILAVAAAVFLVGFFYANAHHTSSEVQWNDSFVTQQLVARDWEMARTTYARFVSDAIGSQIIATGPPSPVSCTTGQSSFTASVSSAWAAAHTYMQNNFGVDCTATPPANVQENVSATASLECTRTIGEVTTTLRHPFVFRKDISFAAGPGTCTLTISDAISSVAEVTQSFP